MDDRMYYNIKYWCKVYFNTQVKCDSVDNHMSECFNAWILAARHKIIITMLEEIRVKMLTRIAKLREFTNTWMCNFSPMSLKVLQENIDRSMNCNIEFNGVDGFEVREGLCPHSVDLNRWILKGIPCAHAVAAIYFKKCEPLDYIDNCYSKETYLRTYTNVLQPATNMEMWPVSTNPTVAPLEIKGMPGRPGHNKRGCSQRVESSTREEPSNIDKGKGKTSGLGPAKRSRERPPAAPSASATPTKSARGRPPATPSTSATPTKGARGRPLIAPATSNAYATPSASAAPSKSARERPPAAPSAPPACPSPANYHVGSSTPADYQSTNSNRGRGRGRGSTTSYKRQAVIGMGVFQAENGFKAFNVTKSADVTGDIGYKPSTTTKLKWNGKVAISTRKLQEMREEQRKKNQEEVVQTIQSRK
ncbi:hypothetical protein H5410_045334 [Solanum commersonii]|uniref:Zinc finger PMZ-type domain-containing protein n=1 Tax=Solanum commersonii TaxID=4109 RepID=A0A9J5XCF5_SOLCO|nr:hypothetical protein H5410_045334 [Solanum commersonii]